jgi:hypothetical protein
MPQRKLQAQPDSAGEETMNPEKKRLLAARDSNKNSG